MISEYFVMSRMVYLRFCRTLLEVTSGLSGKLLDPIMIWSKFSFFVGFGVKLPVLGGVLGVFLIVNPGIVKDFGSTTLA